MPIRLHPLRFSVENLPLLESSNLRPAVVPRRVEGLPLGGEARSFFLFFNKISGPLLLPRSRSGRLDAGPGTLNEVDW